MPEYAKSSIFKQDIKFHKIDGSKLKSNHMLCPKGFESGPVPRINDIRTEDGFLVDK